MAPMARSFAEPLMIDLTCVPATQKRQPEDGLHDDDGCRDSGD